jgi:translation elongation factor EF-1alpha
VAQELLSHFGNFDEPLPDEVLKLYVTQYEKSGKVIKTELRTFSTEVASYQIIDAPGHRDFLKNIISRSTHIDAALV